MPPLMNSSTSSVVNSRPRYARRLSSVDSTPIESKRFLIVRSLSSAARIPLPSATSAFAVSWSSVPIVPPCVVRWAGLWLSLAGLEEEANGPQLLVGGGLDRSRADPPGRVELTPAVLGVVDPRPNDLDARAHRRH